MNRETLLPEHVYTWYLNTVSTKIQQTLTVLTLKDAKRFMLYIDGSAESAAISWLLDQAKPTNQIPRIFGTPPDNRNYFKVYTETMLKRDARFQLATNLTDPFNTPPRQLCDALFEFSHKYFLIMPHTVFAKVENYNARAWDFSYVKYCIYTPLSEKDDKFCDILVTLKNVPCATSPSQF